MQSSVREIRRRLLFLLLRAFVIVLLISFLFFTFIIGYFLTSSSTPVPFPFVSTLEGYYLAKGNWDGIEAVFDSMDPLDSMSTLLLDHDQRVILDRRPDSVSIVGTSYNIQHGDVVFNLTARGEPVGYLVITPYSVSQRFGFARAIIFPVGVISVILALFLVVVSTLLIRRFVNPLADVIYAARAVATGKLDTRIPTEGPQDLRSLSESFNEMATSLERSDRERRDMLADIAHELRTPLSVIRGRLEGIVDGIYSENGPQVSMALEQTYVLQRLVDDLRLLTLAETRQLPFDKRDVDVANVIDSVIEMFSAEAQEKNISLSFNDKNGNLSAWVDPQRFEQVISNLVGNAIRYLPDGGKVWVTAHETAEGLKLTVNDNGEGIPVEDLPYIFDRFWRKEKSRARVSGGTGLGLAITRQLVEAQGGTIEARNLSEGGLQIVVELKK
jgi:two-component system OmpR family sensor kinase/two-component system sensor histidine kinase BaeS